MDVKRTLLALALFLLTVHYVVATDFRAHSDIDQQNLWQVKNIQNLSGFGNFSWQNGTVTIAGSNVCTVANGLCAAGGGGSVVGAQSLDRYSIVVNGTIINISSNQTAYNQSYNLTPQIAQVNLSRLANESSQQTQIDTTTNVLLAVNATSLHNGSDANFTTIKSGIISINTSGTFVNNNQVSQVTYDKTVCASTSTAQDSALAWSCQYLCKSTESNCSSTYNAAIGNGSVTLYFKGAVLSDGTRVPIVLDPSVAGRINLCGKNNTHIIGDGPENTMFVGNGFFVNCNMTTKDIDIENIKVDLNNTANNAFNFNVAGGYCEDCFLRNVVAQNTSTVFLYHGTLCGGGIKDSVFIDAGLVSGADNIAFSNVCSQKRAIADNVQSIKIRSQGGGALTNGGSTNLEITNFFCSDPSGRSYACISMEGQTYNFTNILIDGVIVNYSVGRTGDVAVDDKGYGRTARNIAIRNVIGEGGGVTLRADAGVIASSISDLQLNGPDGAGVTIGNCISGCSASNVNVRNWNRNNYSGSGASTRPCLRVENTANASLNINVLACESTLDQSIGTFYGVRAVNASNFTISNTNFKGLIAANERTFSSSSDYYIQGYVYLGGLGTCESNGTSAGKTLLNNTGSVYQTCSCVGGSWLCTQIENPNGNYVIWPLSIDKQNSRVGIGTATPAQNFVVNGTGSVRAIIQSNTVQTEFLSSSTTGRGYVGTLTNNTFCIRQTDSDVECITTNGNIGIRTLTPTQALEVAGNINATEIYVGGVGATVCRSDGTNCAPQSSSTSGFLNTSGNGNISMADPTVNISFNTMFIDNANNRTGIGISKPAVSFQVNGTGTVTSRVSSLSVNTDILASSSTGKGYVGTGSNHAFVLRTNAADRITIDNLGKVGIGTASPTKTLEVNGSANITGIWYFSGTNATIAVSNATNGCSGDSALVGGAVTVSTTCMTPSSHVFVQDTNSGALANVGSLVVSARNAGNFTVSSTNVLDTSTFSWEIHYTTA